MIYLYSAILTNSSDNEEQTNHQGYTNTFWIGLGMSVITNLIQAFATAYQRKLHLLNDRIFPKELQKKSYQRPMWLIAFISFIIANGIGSIFSIGYLPVILLAPIGAINLVMNAFAANIVLGEPLTRRSILGTGFIMIGALLVGFYGRKRQKMDWYKGVLSGDISSQSMLFAKSGIELIIITIHGENQLQYSLTWFLLVMMILTGAMQLYYLNKGLKLCDNMILIPVSFCSFNLSCLLNGLVYYGQWSLFGWYQLLNVILSVCFTILGVILLSLQQKKKDTKVGMTTTNKNAENHLLIDDHYEPIALLSETERSFLILDQEEEEALQKNDTVIRVYNYYKQ
ncbi:uncharacterized protein BX663DRAFT_548171 [Cokeromyces recurvatus]|uniref:uncharacterized protein n=1 Tax=Cokeromyces recurvatus TaxID=90255 RepID=UPI00221F0674|nr:uncharacterized protein BX663DRAFT_548171 [Cokeromyces recurvatus]KAI7907089.1 hypothetical protein BX663DRAFT_548171 [Cokeromyces recurvatus]